MMQRSLKRMAAAVLLGLALALGAIGAGFVVQPTPALACGGPGGGTGGC